ncbi:glutamate--tRNA ligase [candidate division WWE3 bacterium CG08_land_8_20_14_0_20_40_13]|uniref:Glutamate--tRNA ligase n=1 Tax=candidate division WWE3 bacterium CG08_land_8_20_14_0_20_40_13 TaxID=1975084 RepID=A0A2H0XDJ7_UNCKA|nr:MAG: glutamate--tRNA ligase [candidate division WWE3 bacterium CG08_land_8_20_14_0_20_40_13]
MTRTRVAPSPTGYPHIGTAYQALFDFVYAKKDPRGKFIIRIEDTDKKRFVEGAEQVVYKSLEWLGLLADESPVNGGKYGPYRQSERLDLYQKYASELVERGHAYYCFCSQERIDALREEQEKNHLPPMYDGFCKKLTSDEIQQKIANGEKYVIRMRIPEDEIITVHDSIRGEVKFLSKILDDQVLVKSDGFPTYHLAVVVDDHLMEITHVIRGEEWLSSAPKHILLYKFFGWEEPIWTHLPLLRNPNKGKISKRMGHASIFWYRDEGYLPETVLNFIALTIWGRDKDHEMFSVSDMIKEFDFSKIRIAAPVLDIAKLDWLNGVYIRNLSILDLKKRLIQFDQPIQFLDQNKLDKVLSLIKERMRRLKEFWDLADYFFADPKISKEEMVKQMLKESKLSPSKTIKDLSYLSNLKLLRWEAKEIDEALHKSQDNSQTPPRQFFMPIRIALTGKSQTPPLANVMEVLGKDEVVKRIATAKNHLA